MTTAGLIMTSAGLIMTSAHLLSCLSKYVFNLVAHFQKLFCRFRKWVIVKNKSKLEAKLYDYVRTLCAYNNIFMIYAVIFVACVLLPSSLKLSSEIYTCLGSNKKMSQCGHYTMTCRKMLISTIKRVQFSCKVRFSDSLWFHLPLHTTKYQKFAQSPFKSLPAVF